MLWAILKKEILLTSRDIHALMVLFAMPVAFILIMSLALQNVDADKQQQFSVAVLFANANDEQHPAWLELKGDSIFKFSRYDDKDTALAQAQKDNLLAIIEVPDGFFTAILSDDATLEHKLVVQYAPTTPLVLRQLLLAALQKTLAKTLLQQRLSKQIDDPFLRNGLSEKLMGDALISQTEFSVHDESAGHALKPNSVQQSVPAWLIFSMFFVVIPIATTFITEKQAGTLQRLLTLPVAPFYLLLGKLIPYLVINAIQTVLMFLVGIYVVPLVGGQGLQLADNAWLLLPMSFAVGITAICLALLIATLVRSTEQATTFGGVINLLLAAIGGIMVPVYVMPDFMQVFAKYSPMNWGLEGFLSILLRGGQWSDIALNVYALLALAFGFFVLALLNYRRLVSHH